MPKYNVVLQCNQTKVSCVVVAENETVAASRAIGRKYFGNTTMPVYVISVEECHLIRNTLIAVAIAIGITLYSFPL